MYAVVLSNRKHWLGVGAGIAMLIVGKEGTFRSNQLPIESFSEIDCELSDDPDPFILRESIAAVE